MKQKDKNKLEKRQKVFKILERVIDIIVYLWAIILTLSLIVGSCSGKNKSSKDLSISNTQLSVKKAIQYGDYDYLYKSDYYGVEEIDSATMKLLATRVLGSNGGSSTAKVDLEVNEYYPSGLAFYLQGDFVKLTRSRITLKSMDDSPSSDFYYRVTDFAFFDVYDNVQYVYQSITYPYLNNATQVRFSLNGSIVLSKDLIQEHTNLFDALLNPFYHIEDYHPFSLQFVNSINYNCFFDKDLNSDWVESSSTVPNGYTLNLDYGEFISGGQLFNRIEIYYASSHEVWGFVNSPRDYNEVRHKDDDYSVYFKTMSYVNTVTGLSVVVNVRDATMVSDQNPGVTTQWYSCPVRSSTWVSQSYRDVQFLYGYSEQRLTQLNRLNNGVAYVIGASGTTDVSLVFTLLGNAFTSLIGLFNIAIIPGMTLGLLLFLPLIVVMIVAIVRVLKK